MLQLYIRVSQKNIICLKFHQICGIAKRKKKKKVLFQLRLTVFKEKHHALCFLCALGIAVCLNFSSGWHMMKKHWGSLQRDGIQKIHTHPHRHKKKGKKKVHRSSMTSGSTKLIDLVKLAVLFLYLNSVKPWQDTWGMMLREWTHPVSSPTVTERLKTAAKVSASYQN